MTKVKSIKKNNKLVETLNKKYGAGLKYDTDEELRKSLTKRGVPTLYKLLKITVGRA